MGLDWSGSYPGKARSRHFWDCKHLATLCHVARFVAMTTEDDMLIGGVNLGWTCARNCIYSYVKASKTADHGWPEIEACA